MFDTNIDKVPKTMDEERNCAQSLPGAQLLPIAMDKSANQCDDSHKSAAFHHGILAALFLFGSSSRRGCECWPNSPASSSPVTPLSPTLLCPISL